MNAIYKLIGDDGKEYGPATREQIRQWIAEGRVESRTPIFVDGAKDWNFVGLLPEFAGCFSAAPAPAPTLPAAGRQTKTNSYAQAGMIFGILSVTFCCCCCGFPFGILGLVFSLIGLWQINTNPQLHEGRAMAVAGLILSIISLLMSASSMFFNLLAGQPNVSWNINGI